MTHWYTRFRLLPCSLLAISLHAQTPAAAAPALKPDVSPNVRELFGSSRTILDVPLYGTIGPNVCDEDGDWADALDDTPLSTGTFVRFRSDGRSHTIIDLPPGSNAGENLNWTMSPNGVFRVLRWDGNAYELFSFMANGHLSSRYQIAVPQGVMVTGLAVQNSGVSYVRGYRPSGKGSKASRPEFAAIFAVNGSLYRDLSSEKSPVDLSHMTQFPLEGAVTAGDDGLFYKLTPDKIQALNTAGDVVRSYELPRPDLLWHADRIDVSGGLISIEFAQQQIAMHRALPLILQTAVIDAQTGELRGRYRFAPELGNNLVCFTRAEGYTVVKFISNRQVAIRVPLQ